MIRIERVQIPDARRQVVERRRAVVVGLLLIGESPLRLAQPGIDVDVALRRHVGVPRLGLQLRDQAQRQVAHPEHGVAAAEQPEVERRAIAQRGHPLQIGHRRLAARLRQVRQSRADAGRTRSPDRRAGMSLQIAIASS